jgi:murein DD-endopeptidase MepM/ murein hydrolase activator NlpD
VQGWGRIGRAGIVIFFLGWASACSQGLYYQVRAGDTLSALSQRYGVSSQEIARYNAIRNPDKLEVGQMLRIPSGQPGKVAAAPKPSSFSSPRATPEKRKEDDAPLVARRRNDGNTPFMWPVEGPITSTFGPRNGSFHDGIDIAAPVGTQVLATAEGKVIFSDVLRGYGNVVIVRHANGYLTVYAHNRTNLVKEGQSVRQGEPLAEVGQSGRTTGASLHFEVRKDNLARDPLRYLPQERRTVQDESSSSAPMKESAAR